MWQENKGKPRSDEEVRSKSRNIRNQSYSARCVHATLDRMLALYCMFTLVLLSNGIWLSTTSEKSLEWRKPGCHKVGHTRKVDIAGCISFDVTTNACRGFCESWAVPSDPRNTQITQPITSTGSCCNIMETEPIQVNVMCDSGMRTFIFKSAVTCSCYHCKKD